MLVSFGVLQQVWPSHLGRYEAKRFDYWGWIQDLDIFMKVAASDRRSGRWSLLMIVVVLVSMVVTKYSSPSGSWS